MSFRTSWLVATVVWSVIGSTLRAQRVEEPQNDASLHMGPVLVAPAVAFTSGVDTNVFNTSAQQRSDYVSTLSPKAAASVRLGAARLTAKGAADLVYYHDLASERTINLDGGATLSVPLNRVRPFVSMTYLRTRDRATIEVDARALRHEGSVSAGANIRLSGKTAVEVSATSWKVAYDASAVYYDTYLQDAFNRVTNKAEASLRYQLTPLTAVTVAADASDAQFALSPIRDARSYRVAPGVEFQQSALITGKASVGYRKFDGRSSLMPDYTGPILSAELGYTLRESTRIQVQAGHDVEYSYEADAPYYVISGYGGSVIQRLAEAVGLTARASRYQVNFRSLATFGLGPGAPRPSDRLTIAGLGGLYKASRDLRLNLGVDYYHRDSPVAGREYSGIRGGFSVVYGFPN